MEFYEVIQKRASIRQYKKKPINRSTIEKLIDAGRRAPSARAVEPWEFIIIQDTQKLESISRSAPNGAFVSSASACIAVYCRETKYYLEDGVAATENILLQAFDCGLGACWIAGDKKPYASDISKLLNVPGEYKLISLIAIGWAEKTVEQNKKRTLTEVIHWEIF